MAFNEVISELAQETGAHLEAMDGICAFAVGDDADDLVKVLLQDLGNGRHLVLWADLGAPPPECKDTLWRTALEANDLLDLTGGATLSVIPGNGHFRLQRIESFEEMELSGRSHLEGFIDTALKWHQIVVKAQMPEKTQEESPEAFMMDSTFISI